MSKSFASFVVLLSMTTLSVATPLAQEMSPVRAPQAPSDSIAASRLAGLEIAQPSERSIRLTDSGRHSASAKEDGARRTAKKRDGRKAMWITIAASVAGVALAMRFAPEAPIPTTPSSGLYKCTSFYRPGTLMTTSGYTCVLR